MFEVVLLVLEAIVALLLIGLVALVALGVVKLLMVASVVLVSLVQVDFLLVLMIEVIVLQVMTFVLAADVVLLLVELGCEDVETWLRYRRSIKTGRRKSCGAGYSRLARFLVCATCLAYLAAAFLPVENSQAVVETATRAAEAGRFRAKLVVFASSAEHLPQRQRNPNNFAKRPRRRLADASQERLTGKYGIVSSSPLDKGRAASTKSTPPCTYHKHDGEHE